MKRTILSFFAVAAMASPFQSVISALPTSFPVSPRQFHTWIYSPTNDCRIYGRFEAAGGARNDIDVLLLTADEMQNWTNHNRTQVLYESGWVTVGNLDLRVPPGNYNVVFQNRDASMRTVTTDIVAEW